MPGFSSTLTLTSTTLPSVLSVTFSRIGPIVRHGPHHGAHRSTITGVFIERSRTSVWNVASETSTAMPAGYRSAAIGLSSSGRATPQRFDRRPAAELGRRRGGGLGG